MENVSNDKTYHMIMQNEVAKISMCFSKEFCQDQILIAYFTVNKTKKIVINFYQEKLAYLMLYACCFLTIKDII